MNYIVSVREVHIQGYQVEADSPEEAKNMVMKGGGEAVESMFRPPDLSETTMLPIHSLVAALSPEKWFL